MKQYFKKQLADGIPLTLPMIEENILKYPFKTKQLETAYRSKVGTFPVFYALRDMSDDSVMICVVRIYNNKLETLPTDWKFEKTTLPGTPVFQSKSYQDYVATTIQNSKNEHL